MKKLNIIPNLYGAGSLEHCNQFHEGAFSRRMHSVITQIDLEYSREVEN